MSSSDTKARETSAPASGASFTSYSLNFEDVILNRLFPHRQRGFYVDVGAGHPRFENDLYALYERGWNGINIEPNEAFFALHEQIRPRDRNLCMVLSDAAGEPLTYYEIEGSGLSTCDEAQAKVHVAHGHSVRARRVPVGTLTGILTEAGARQIDVLKVDVEGFEQKVLSGNDWEQFRPSVVVVEATYPESPERRPTNIRGFLEQRGYRHVLFDGLNDFYLEQSFLEPPGLTLPPNVFDGFVPREIADLRDQSQALRTEFTSAEGHARSLQAALSELQVRFDEAQQTAADALKAAESLASEKAEGYVRSLQAALSELQARYDEAQQTAADALKAAESLASENRRLGRQASSLAKQNQRWRSAADQMRAEITVLNRLLEPLHSVAEQMNHMRRGHERELHLLRTETQRQISEEQAKRQHLEAELLRQIGEEQAERQRLEAERQRLEAESREIHARLQNVYASRSWLLTKPWRFAGRALKRLGR